ncbi:MAG: 6,7-dimethyl-8-ribityllumazine synthase [Terriglobales bacterium]
MPTARKPRPLRTHSGDLRAEGLRFALVVSRFNEFITERLLASATETLLRLGARRRDLEVVRVPGAFEIPAAARHVAATGRFHAILCLGLILRGETPHFDFISREVTRGIGQSALQTGVPHGFGILTCDTLEEAIQRAGLKSGNKGGETALAAVEMASLFAATGRSAVRQRPPVGNGRSFGAARPKVRRPASDG